MVGIYAYNYQHKLIYFKVFVFLFSALNLGHALYVTLCLHCTILSKLQIYNYASITILIVIVVASVIRWLVNGYILMQRTVKNILNEF